MKKKNKENQPKMISMCIGKWKGLETIFSIDHERKIAIIGGEEHPLEDLKNMKSAIDG